MKTNLFALEGQEVSAVKTTLINNSDYELQIKTPGKPISVDGPIKKDYYPFGKSWLGKGTYNTHNSEYAPTAGDDANMQYKSRTFSRTSLI